MTDTRQQTSAWKTLRQAVHAATADLWTPPRETDERTNQLYALVRAEVMHEQAAMLRRHCPDHSGIGFGAFMACHCPAADQLDRDADRTLTARTAT